ncbi:hypothetical protein TrispH2_004829 [Trichoplax sp. H2]|nr:hypothetical protein TrispH2_004829 [Trichoplax sp. H2]|eukprot:RDD42653.1 hypothetical protein TrispH2_004829 [Trichoplax sp. H2]
MIIIRKLKESKKGRIDTPLVYHNPKTAALKTDPGERLLYTFYGMVYRKSRGKKGWDQIGDTFLPISLIQMKSSFENPFKIVVSDQNIRLVDYLVSTETKTNIDSGFVQWFSYQNTFGARFSHEKLATELHFAIERMISTMAQTANLISKNKDYYETKIVPLQAARKGRGGKLANEVVIEVYINHASIATKFSMSPSASLKDLLEKIAQHVEANPIQCLLELSPKPDGTKPEYNPQKPVGALNPKVVHFQVKVDPSNTANVETANENITENEIAMTEETEDLQVRSQEKQLITSNDITLTMDNNEHLPQERKENINETVIENGVVESEESESNDERSSLHNSDTNINDSTIMDTENEDQKPILEKEKPMDSSIQDNNMNQTAMSNAETEIIDANVSVDAGTVVKEIIDDTIAHVVKEAPLTHNDESSNINDDTIQNESCLEDVENHTSIAKESIENDCNQMSHDLETLPADSMTDANNLPTVNDQKIATESQQSSEMIEAEAADDIIKESNSANENNDESHIANIDQLTKNQNDNHQLPQSTILESKISELDTKENHATLNDTTENIQSINDETTTITANSVINKEGERLEDNVDSSSMPVQNTTAPPLHEQSSQNSNIQLTQNIESNEGPVLNNGSAIQSSTKVADKIDASNLPPLALDHKQVMGHSFTRQMSSPAELAPTTTRRKVPAPPPPSSSARRDTKERIKKIVAPPPPSIIKSAGFTGHDVSSSISEKEEAEKFQNGNIGQQPANVPSEINRPRSSTAPTPDDSNRTRSTTAIQKTKKQAPPPPPLRSSKANPSRIDKVIPGQNPNVSRNGTNTGKIADTQGKKAENLVFNVPPPPPGKPPAKSQKPALLNSDVDLNQLHFNGKSMMDLLQNDSKFKGDQNNYLNWILTSFVIENFLTDWLPKSAAN